MKEARITVRGSIIYLGCSSCGHESAYTDAYLRGMNLMTQCRSCTKRMKINPVTLHAAMREKRSSSDS